jgi:hypothetical protein
MLRTDRIIRTEAPQIERHSQVLIDPARDVHEAT